jgi:hypothetical protein
MANIATVAYRTRTVCNTEISDYWYYYGGGTGTTRSGSNLLWQRDDQRRINGSGPKKTRSRALRINDRGDGTGLDEQEAKGVATTTSRFLDVDRYVRYNHNVDAAMRKYRRNSAYSDNDSTQWRSRDA